MSDDVTALVEQPQSGDVTLVVAGVVARLVARRHDYSEVGDQSMNETSYTPVNAATVDADVLRVRSEHRPRLGPLQVELRIPADDENLCDVVPEK